MNFLKVWDKYGIYILTAAVFVVFWIMLGMRYVTLFNISNVLLTVSMVAIAGTSMVFAITSGGFDLSIGATQTLTTVVVAMGLKFWGLPIPVAIIVALGVGVLVGLMNGLIITKLKVQTFVTTLASMLIIRGIAFIMFEGKNIMITEFMDYKAITATSFLGFSMAVWMMIGFVIFGWILYRFTRFGVFTRSLGSNELAVRISGVPADRTIILIFIFSAITAVVSGIITSSMTLLGNANYGTAFPLEVITATILGGTSLSGGKGNIPGMLCAAVLLGFIKNGLNMLNVPFFYQDLATGVVLIFALFMGSLHYLVGRKADVVKGVE